MSEELRNELRKEASPTLDDVVRSNRTIGFVLVNTETDSESEVLQSLKKIEEVEEAYRVYGVYDIVAKIEVESMDDLKDVVTAKMRSLNMVRTILPLIVIK